jgi:hypothetical protein
MRTTGPTDGGPSFSTTGSSCPAGSKFPDGYNSFVSLVQTVFEPQTANAAINKASVINNLMTQGKQSNAIKQAFQFIAWTLERDKQGKVTNQPNESTMISRILCGVGTSGLPNGIDDPTDPNVGVGFYDPNSTQPTTIKTNNGIAGTQLPPGSLKDPSTGLPISVPATIVIYRLPDTPFPLNTTLTQYAPFFFYDASYQGNCNESGTCAPKFDPPATVGFCLSTVNPPPPSAVLRVGHNKDDIGFELLPESTIPFSLNCSSVGNFQLTSAASGGFQNLAAAAWRATVDKAGSIAEAVFLPEPAHAFWFGSGTIGGKATSFSPFGTVDVNAAPPGFGSTDWTYQQIASTATPPTNWQTADQSFGVGSWLLTNTNGNAPGTRAPFGDIGGVPSCQANGLATPSTPWSPSTNLLARRDVYVPPGVTSATISVLIDNDIQVFVNGFDVSNGLQAHENCANLSPPGPFVVNASTNAPTASIPLQAGVVNKIAILAADRGGQSFLDAKITFAP